MDIKFIQINNMKLEYIVKGKGIDILFIHGGSVSFRSYLPFIEELTAYTRVWAPSLPGAGKSVNLGKDCSIDKYADVVYKFAKKFKIKPIIIAHSLGGGVAIKVKARYPKLFRELVLLASAGVRYKQPGNAIFQVFKDKIKILFAKEVGSKEERKDLFINLFYHLVDIGKISKIFSDSNVEEDMTKILDQVLSFWGKNDKIFNYKYIEEFNSKLRKNKSFILDGPHGFVNKNRNRICNIIKKEILNDK